MKYGSSSRCINALTSISVATKVVIFLFFIAAASSTAYGMARASQYVALAPPSDDLQVVRIVMLYRHGLRAPLKGEIGAEAYAQQPWPVWSTRPGRLTPHGREGMRLLGVYDRALFTLRGLLSSRGCPTTTNIAIWSDSDARSIASGHELAEGLAPGCELHVGHLASGAKDPLFTADAPGAKPFDTTKALHSIINETGGPGELIKPHRAQIHILEHILGCRAQTADKPCDIASKRSTLITGRHSLKLKGPIEITSGTAEVFMLQYAEGMPLDRVGWGRANLARLSQISRLHALLFDVFDRPTYMAHRTAAAMAPRISKLLGGARGSRVMLFVGHDNNIAALAKLIGADFKIPTYGKEDPPIGGALGFEILADKKTSARYVRVFYQAQTLNQLRALTPLSLAVPPATEILTPTCAIGTAKLCDLSALRELLCWPGQR